MAVITLLSDFGLDDEYVGVMKGVILATNAQARIVDITHRIAPQDRVSAAYCIRSAYRYFPKGTVHVVVVDPGVGTSRAIVAVKIQGHIFLAPDNGVLTLVFDEHKAESVVRVADERYYLNPVSRTFHGRDIMAPVAGHLSMGVEMDRLGPGVSVEDLQRLPLGQARLNGDGILKGSVVLIDRFGNLITNIDSEKLACLADKSGDRGFEIRIGQALIPGLSQSYADVPHQAPLAIIGSKGYLEIAINCGRAEDYFEAHCGDPVSVSAESAISAPDGAKTI
jgi:S-adenosylmethionine hydrolase